MKYIVKLDKLPRAIECDNLASIRGKLGEYLGIVTIAKHGKMETWQHFTRGIVKVKGAK